MLQLEIVFALVGIFICDRTAKRETMEQHSLRLHFEQEGYGDNT